MHGSTIIMSNTFEMCNYNFKNEILNFTYLSTSRWCFHLLKPVSGSLKVEGRLSLLSLTVQARYKVLLILSDIHVHVNTVI